MTSQPLDPEDGAVTFTVSVVARRIGVASATLRTWDRRYGLGPSVHTTGQHRRYTEADLRRLELMRQLVNKGMAAADAARAACNGTAPQVVTRLRLASTELKPQNLETDVSEAIRGLSRSAEALDSLGCQELISNWLNHFGAVKTWDELLRPVLVHLGSLWQNSSQGVETEHLLSDAAATALKSYAVGRLRNRSPRPVLMAGAPGELHTLPLVATAAAAAELQIECRILGANVPYSSLASAITRVGPAAVMVWSQAESTGDPTRLASLPTLRPAYRVLLGGPGWQEPLPRNAERVASLDSALAAMAAATA